MENNGTPPQIPGMRQVHVKLNDAAVKRIVGLADFLGEEPTEIANLIFGMGGAVLDLMMMARPITDEIVKRNLQAEVHAPSPAAEKKVDPDDVDNRTPAQRLADRRAAAGLSIVKPPENGGQ